MGGLGAGSVALVKVWEVWERDLHSGRALGAVGEFWARCGISESWIRRSGRGLGALGAGFVVPDEVWELQEVRMFNGLKRA